MQIVLKEDMHRFGYNELVYKIDDCKLVFKE